MVDLLLDHFSDLEVENVGEKSHLRNSMMNDDPEIFEQACHRTRRFC